MVQHTDSLRGYALNFTRDDDDAKDLVQDTVLKAVTYYSKFRDGTNLKGWLYTIMKNTFINHYRRIVKMNASVSRPDEISDAHLSLSASRNGGEGKFVMDDISGAMDKLSDDYYIPFSMYFEGYRYHEISEHMNIPIGTVKTRIHMARKLMKQTLAPYRHDRN